MLFEFFFIPITTKFFHVFRHFIYYVMLGSVVICYLLSHYNNIDMSLLRLAIP